MTETGYNLVWIADHGDIKAAEEVEKQIAHNLHVVKDELAKAMIGWQKTREHYAGELEAAATELNRLTREIERMQPIVDAVMECYHDPYAAMAPDRLNHLAAEYHRVNSLKNFKP